MADRMDTNMDSPSFDLQSTYVSFEERRWLINQRCSCKLDHLVQQISDLHKKIHGSKPFDDISKSAINVYMRSKLSLDDNYVLYYSSPMYGVTDTQIDQFRLQNQHRFQLLLADLCTDLNYRIFIIIMEGFIFYSSQTVKEYTSTMTSEMQQCLASLDTYIRSRAPKIIDLLTILQKSSLPSYKSVHAPNLNNTGVLFQLCPKVPCHLPSTTEYNSIMAVDQYANHTLSPEELRYVDYSMDMKHKRHGRQLQQPITNTAPVPKFRFTKPGFWMNGSIASNTYHNLHSLPIIYPYTDEMIYGKKYPSFWTGDNHTNENSDVLFQNVPIEKTSDEFLFVERSFHKTMSDKEIKIAIIERIQNPHLWEKFSSHRSYMRRKNGAENLNENWLFHGTKSDNHHQIMNHGFNRSYCRDTVFYGRGVYFSSNAAYSCNYSDRQDLSFLFLCRVLVGYHTAGSNDMHVPPKIPLSNGKQIQADSTTDSKTPYSIACTFHDDQNYPEYIITYMNKRDEF